MTTDLDDEGVQAEVADRLAEKNPDLPRAEIEAAVRAEFAELAGRPVRDYLSVLTERAAKKRLKKAGKRSA